jgi:hypothetical protein
VASEQGKATRADMTGSPVHGEGDMRISVGIHVHHSLELGPVPPLPLCVSAGVAFTSPPFTNTARPGLKSLAEQACRGGPTPN